jgi:NAD(P)-dependent dehydrogenase (short-subunit alcohol dehydrogenase family)
MAEFSGKVALVAGGSTGIGKGAAGALARQGASVLICGRDPGKVDATVSELRAQGSEVTGVAADVSSAADMQRFVQAGAERYGGVDVLVNSAGIQTYGTVTETDEALWDQTIDINLKGIYLAAREAIPEMRKRGGGVIINVSSVQGLATQKGVAAYSTSKAAINGLTRAIAVDHAHENIRCLVVCPASVDTPMLRWSAERFRGEGTMEEMLESWGRMHPVGRIGQPDEIGELIAFLASPRAGFLTGSEIKADGGMMAALGVVLPE